MGLHWGRYTIKQVLRTTVKRVTVRRMTELRKSVLRTVRLDDDVWAAVKQMNCSLNQYLRTALLDHPLTAKSMITLATPERQPLPTLDDIHTRLDATGSEPSSGRGKATVATRGPRQKGDKTR